VSQPLELPGALEWSRLLEAGVPDLDDQHHELFVRSERLILGLARADRAEVDPLVRSLSDFVASHLGCEERWMAETEYPGLVAHRDAHWRFRDEVQARARIYQRRGPSPAMARAIRAWLAGWLYPHLGVADLELGRWLAKHRPGPT